MPYSRKHARLQRDLEEEKRHYKLFKKGKLWMTAGMSLLVAGLMLAPQLDVAAAEQPSVTDQTSAATQAAATTQPADYTGTAVTVTAPAMPINGTVAPTAKVASDLTAPSFAASDFDVSTVDAAKAGTYAVTLNASGLAKLQAANPTHHLTEANVAAGQVTVTAPAATATPAKTTTAPTKPAQPAAKTAATKTPATTSQYSDATATTVATGAQRTQQQLSQYVAQDDQLAAADPQDTIVNNAAMHALKTSQAKETKQVLDLTAGAKAIAAANPSAAVAKLAQAAQILNTMNQELTQAAVMLDSDRNGAKSGAKAAAQAALAQAVLPTGATGAVDAYGDLIITAGDTTTYQAAVAAIKAQGLLSAFREVVDPAQSDSLTWNTDNAGLVTVNNDGSASFNLDGLKSIYSAVSFNFSYTGNAGDTFHVTVPGDLPGGIGYKMNTQATGDPVITYNADGSATLTWTVANTGDTLTQTVTLNQVGDANWTAPADLASHTTASGGIGGSTGGIEPGTALTITYGGTNVDDQTTKLTLDSGVELNGAELKQITVWNPGSSLLYNGVNYAFQLDLDAGDPAAAGSTNSMAGKSIGVATNYIIKHAEIAVPIDFTLNEAATEQANYQLGRAIEGLSITQPDGKGGNLIVSTTGTVSANDELQGIRFVGSFAGYTQADIDAVTAGKWLGNPKVIDETMANAYFALKSLSYSHTASGPVKDMVVTEDSPSATHDAPVGTREYVDYLNYFLVVLRNNTTAQIKSDNNLSLNLTGLAANDTGKLLIGDTTSNVLATMGYQVSGTRPIAGTINVAVPDGIDSTGLYVPLASQAWRDWTNNQPLTYDITVDYSDGTSASFSQVKEGTTLSTLPGTGTVNTTTMLTVPAGAHITGYHITPNKMDSGDSLLTTDQFNFGGGGENVNGQPYGAVNDLYAQSFGILGHVDSSVADGTVLNLKYSFTPANDLTVYSPDKVVPLTAVASAPITLNTISDTGTTITPGQTFSLSLGVSGDTNQTATVNLNANGYYLNNIQNGGIANDNQTGYANRPTDKDRNDATGFAGVSRIKFEPVFYVTVPKQTQLVKNTDGTLFTKVGAGWNGVSATPTVTQYTNADGQIVYKLDYTGTGLNWLPSNMQLKFNFKADSDANTAGLNIANTSATSYAVGSTTVNVPAAANGGKDGEATPVFMVAGDDTSAVINTKPFDAATAGSNYRPEDAQNLSTTLTDADGNTTKVSGLSMFAINMSNISRDAFAVGYGDDAANTLAIQAPAKLNLGGTIKGNMDEGYSDDGANAPLPNGTDAETVRMRMTNDTSSTVANVAGILNLPQTNTPNTADAAGTFALKLTGPVKEGNATTTLYSTHQLTMSDDGATVTLDNGHVLYLDGSGTSTTTADDLQTADQVTDWSSIAAILTQVPTLAAQASDEIVLNVADPTSADDKGKVTSFDYTYRADGLQNVFGTIKDSILTTGIIKNVDQNGNIINGDTNLTQATFDDAGQPESNPYGKTGDTISNDTSVPIPGYIYVWTDGDSTLKADGSATLVNHYQLDQAKLVVDGADKETATGDATPNTSTTTTNPAPTGTNQITFQTTDADLAQPGKTYFVTVTSVAHDPSDPSKAVPTVEGTIYPTLAAAVAAHPDFDDIVDNYSIASQVFTVNYIAMAGATKQYDGDASTDPTTYTVTLPAGFTAPTWTAADFDNSGITSQDVGDYTVTLSAQGLSDLQAANPDYDFSKLDPTTISATFSITKAPITITAPTATKVYDGTPYADALTATVTGQPTKGVAPVYTLNDVSGDVNVGEYALTVTADPAANKNYDITVAPGKLTITPAALTIAAPTVTKVYDGKGYTTALTGTVTTLPTAGVTPTYTLTDVSGDKNVGEYAILVTVDASANPNYTITTTNGKLTITPAAITITAPTKTKVYDGKGYSDPLTGTVSGVPEGADQPTYTLSDVSGDKNVGEYAIKVTADASANPNYTITLADGKLTITPAAITITAPTKTKVYDGKGYADKLTGTVTGVPAGAEQPTYTLSDVSGDKNAGEYTITVTADATANPNYTVTTANGKLTITKAPVSVTAPNVTKKWDNQPYTGDNLVGTVTGQPTDGDPVAYQLSDLSGDTAVGTYPITITVGTNPNYDVTTTPGTLTITEADTQYLKVNYEDDTTGKHLRTDTDHGYTGTQSDYKTAGAIAAYEQDGYDLVSDNFPASGVTFDNDTAVDQLFTVHLKHHVDTVTPGNPHDPGTPIDPSNPTGPQWPTGVTETDLNHTVTETIQYRFANGKTAAPTHQVSLTFTRSATVDDVTGAVSYTDWTPTAGDSFAAVTAPQVPGYIADPQEVAAVVGVTGDSADLSYTVTYNAKTPESTPVTPTTPTATKQPTATPAAPAAPSGNRLPTTGDAQNDWLAIAGIGLFATLGLVGMRKREDTEK
ncbi:MBG domain-containing protein [Lacticaseibacillus nasuensis]|uniref:MBG domain-containing protein n=1 Tax=Lacticaseibacillus nasuensis TaxID=944671 RepID=UPI002247BFE2|nr:MBG domain-containing protein [Lacticaseibacillus nasuensis]MCX2454607.1 MBG domain-containing protein [Lacticaseibacillus nasuensis]